MGFLQLLPWLLLTAYRNSSSPYPTVPSSIPTMYRYVRYRQTDRQKTTHRFYIYFLNL